MLEDKTNEKDSLSTCFCTDDVVEIIEKECKIKIPRATIKKVDDVIEEAKDDSHYSGECSGRGEQNDY